MFVYNLSYTPWKLQAALCRLMNIFLALPEVCQSPICRVMTTKVKNFSIVFACRMPVHYWFLSGSFHVHEHESRVSSKIKTEGQTWNVIKLWKNWGAHSYTGAQEHVRCHSTQKKHLFFSSYYIPIFPAKSACIRFLHIFILFSFTYTLSNLPHPYSLPSNARISTPASIIFSSTHQNPQNRKTLHNKDGRGTNTGMQELSRSVLFSSKSSLTVSNTTFMGIQPPHLDQKQDPLRKTSF